MNCRLCGIKIDGRKKLSKEEGICWNCDRLCEIARYSDITDEEMKAAGCLPVAGCIYEEEEVEDPISIMMPPTEPILEDIKRHRLLRWLNK